MNIFVLKMSEKMNLADALESKTYDDGECIIKQACIINYYVFCLFKSHTQLIRPQHKE